jgi:hypothetical protein
LTRKKYLDHFQQLHTPAPDWLQNDTSSLDGWDQSEENVLDTMEEEESPIKEDEEPNNEKTPGNPKQPREPLDSTLFFKDLDKDKDNLMSCAFFFRNRDEHEDSSTMEHVLQHHRQLHDEMTTDLGKMAHQLKLNSQSFGDILQKDDTVNNREKRPRRRGWLMCFLVRFYGMRRTRWNRTWTRCGRNGID